jgi:transitional endoplasmic reticulum ATPase
MTSWIVRYWPSNSEFCRVVDTAGTSSESTLGAFLDRCESRELTREAAAEIDHVDVGLSDALPQISIVDCPGLGSTEIADESRLLRATEDADVVVWVVDVQAAGSLRQAGLVSALFEKGLPRIIVLNKCDLVKPSERDEVVQYLRSRFDIGNDPIFQVAALAAFEGRHDDAGETDSFRQYVETSIVARKTEIRVQAANAQAEAFSRAALDMIATVQNRLLLAASQLNRILVHIESVRGSVESSLQEELEGWVRSEFYGDRREQLVDALSAAIEGNKGSLSDEQALAIFSGLYTDKYVDDFWERILARAAERAVELWRLRSDEFAFAVDGTADSEFMTQWPDVMAVLSIESIDADIAKVADNTFRTGTIVSAGVAVIASAYVAGLGASAAAITMSMALTGVGLPIAAVGAFLSWGWGQAKKKRARYELRRELEGVLDGVVEKQLETVVNGPLRSELRRWHREQARTCNERAVAQVTIRLPRSDLEGLVVEVRSIGDAIRNSNFGRTKRLDSLSLPLDAEPGPLLREPAIDSDQDRPDQDTASGEEADLREGQEGQNKLALRVERPETLPTFDDIGGMDELKQDLMQAMRVGRDPKARKLYRVSTGGLLLSGDPGVGKTFFARAVAGEFGFSFIKVSAEDLLTALWGEAPRNIGRAFALAAQNVPCVLFFDEVDSIAQSRDDLADSQSRTMVNALLSAMDRYREVHNLVVIAATNSSDNLDPAFRRRGRFDRHFRVGYPDAAARSAMLRAMLSGRPGGEDVDVSRITDASSGLSQGVISAAVEDACRLAAHEYATSGMEVPITTQAILDALWQPSGSPAESLTWDDLVLDAETKDRLREIATVFEDMEAARSAGIEPPTGLLLIGPLGTGKTTIAKVLAGQTRTSFFSLGPADVNSKWVGESEKKIKRTFQEARERQPSIIFLDEIDQMVPDRAFVGPSWSSAVTTQIGIEMDGIASNGRIFLVGATNFPDRVDPMIVSRLGETITVPLPDETGRRSLLDLLTSRAKRAGVDLDKIAASTEGFSGRDLKILVTQAWLASRLRHRSQDGAEELQTSDFLDAIERVRAKSRSGYQR